MMVFPSERVLLSFQEQDGQWGLPERPPGAEPQPHRAGRGPHHEPARRPLYASLPSLSMEQPLALTKNSLDAGRPAGLSPTLAPVERQQVRLCPGAGTPSTGLCGDHQPRG